VEPDRTVRYLLTAMKPSFTSLATLVFTWANLTGCVVAEDHVHNLSDKVDESSGIVASRTYEGVFWTHEDNGLSNNIYAVDASGDFLFKTDVAGSKNVDWEDIAIDDEGYLYVADVGNNANDRTHLLVYRVKEPNPNDPSSNATVSKRIRFTYPTQDAFPDESDLNYDAEAIFFAGGTLYLLSKNRSNTATDLYRFPSLEAANAIDLEHVATFELGYDILNEGGKVTAADVSPDGTCLAMLCYDAIYLFAQPAMGDNWFSGGAEKIELDQSVTGQAEGIAFYDGHLVLTNEEGELHHLESALLGATSYP
jgi:hypothetical protein